MNKIETYLININNKTYNVNIRKKKIKRIIIRVNPKNEIFLNCPIRCSYDEAYHYLLEHLTWLEKVIIKQETNIENMEVEDCRNKKKIWLFGNLYNIIHDNTISTAYIIKDDNLFIKDNIDKTLDIIKNELLIKIEEEFNLCYTGFIKHISQKPYLEIRKMKSRWGSCNYRTGRIVINKLLIHVPRELIHFVMIHEFVHFIHPNHSKSFHDFLKQCIPDYKTLEKRLKNYSFLLQL